jgi:hypothetical protein
MPAFKTKQILSCFSLSSILLRSFFRYFLPIFVARLNTREKITTTELQPSRLHSLFFLLFCCVHYYFFSILLCSLLFFFYFVVFIIIFFLFCKTRTFMYVKCGCYVEEKGK